MNLQRIDKIISSQLNISRNIARKIIRYGKISVNGKIIRDFALQVDPENSKIEHRGQALIYKKNLYLIMNKPKGIISASEDKFRETVISLVPEKLRRNGLFPVGRLDRDTTGLLLITDDGDFAHKIISPKKNIIKTYVATLDGPINQNIIDAFSEGITLADGTECRPAQLKSLGNNLVEIKISEGKYHQIKRMFGTVNLGVNDLKRTAIGNLLLPEELPPGECRELFSEELNLIFDN